MEGGPAQVDRSTQGTLTRFIKTSSEVPFGEATATWKSKCQWSRTFCLRTRTFGAARTVLGAHELSAAVQHFGAHPTIPTPLRTFPPISKLPHPRHPPRNTLGGPRTTLGWPKSIGKAHRKQCVRRSRNFVHLGSHTKYPPDCTHSGPDSMHLVPGSTLSRIRAAHPPPSRPNPPPKSPPFCRIYNPMGPRVGMRPFGPLVT